MPVLEFAVLGVLAESPVHGYQLRKRLSALRGGLRTFSYGSLYPTLRRLQARGLITEQQPTAADAVTAPALATKRARIVYQLTTEGKEHFAELLADAGPNAWEDELFDLHLAFFGQTDADVRLRILQGRRRRLEEQREGMRSALARTRDRLDRYTDELARHGLEAADREVRWLEELIASERQAAASPNPRRRQSTDNHSANL